MSSNELDFGYNKKQTVFIDVPQSHFKYYSLVTLIHINGKSTENDQHYN